MSNTSKSSKADLLARLEDTIGGLQKRFPNGSLNVGGTVYVVATLVLTLQGLADAINAANTAQLGAKKAVANAKTSKANVLPVLTAVRRLVVAMFANDPQALADFGVSTPKVAAPRSGAANAAAAVKAKATRTARGTKGPKAIKAVKGNVTGVEITPITAPATPAPTAPQQATPVSNALPSASKP